MVAVLVEGFLDSPCPRVGLTITGLGIGESVVTLWRSADGEREPVSGYRRVTYNDATYITDYHAPVGRPVTYEVEVVSGPTGTSRTMSAPVTLDTGAVGFIMDPLIPQSCIPIVGERTNREDIYLRGQALAALEYAADVQLFEIMGQSKPMALFGQRMAEKGVDTSLGLRSAEENARLKKLLQSTAHLLFRPSPAWGRLELSGAMFIGNSKATQVPVNVMMGGDLTWWDMVSDVVQAPAIKVLTATFTYGDVQILMDTYQQKQDLMTGKSYLDDLKNPIG